MDLDRIVRFYQEFSRESLGGFADLYSADAWFKDPFNEVRGVEAIQRIFTHMFRQVDAPRFVVTGQMARGDEAMLVWEFRYRVRRWGRGEEQVIRGVSHLKFAVDGKVDFHRDYWDAAEELYMKLPLIGRLMSGLRRLFAT